MFNSALKKVDWPVVNLVDQLEQIIDNRGKTPPKSECGIPSLSAKSVKMGAIDYSKVYFVSEDAYKKFMVRGLPKVGDVLLTTEAPLGCVARLDRDDVCLAQRLITLRGKEGILDNDYLRFYLSSPIGQHELISRASGSTVQGIKRSEFCKVDIILPPYDKQLEIASRIRSIEEKLELNRQTNQTLENIAQAIFKSWFIDFEPTRAKIATKQNGEDPECAAMSAISGKTITDLNNLPPEQQQSLKSTAALFPNTLTDSELGEIPEGWEVKEIKELSLKLSKGTTPRKIDIQTSEDAETIPFLKVRNISNDGEITRIGLDKVPESIHLGVLKRSILETDDLLFSIAGTIGRVAVVEEDLSNSNCNQAVAFIRLKEPDVYRDLCRLNLVGNKIQNEVVSKVVQGVQANFSLTGLGEIRICIATEALITVFNENIVSISKKQQLLLSENRKLSELRDTLLPKLLSGELETTEIKKDAA